MTDRLTHRHRAHLVQCIHSMEPNNCFDNKIVLINNIAQFHVSIVIPKAAYFCYSNITKGALLLKVSSFSPPNIFI